jgi:hypothetical protein
VAPGRLGSGHATVARGTRGLGGKGAGGGGKADCGGTMLSASWEAAMSHTGEIDCCCKDGSPIPPPLLLQGLLLVVGWQVFVAGKGQRCGSDTVVGGNPNNVPHARRGTTAVVNTVAFFARMGAFACWQGEGCGHNGGGNVLALAAARAGSRWLKASRRGEEADAVTRRWECCRVVGGRRMTQ